MFTGAVNFFIQNEDGSSKLAGASYFGFFTAMMLVTALLFVVVARFYREQSYLQEEKPAPQEDSAVTELV